MRILIGKIDETVLVRLLDKKFHIISEIRRKNGDLLKLIDSLSKKSLKNIKGIIVVNDSGTFSGIRNAVTIGNTLSFALKIPIASVSIKDIDNKKKLKTTALGKKVTFIMPKYSKEPNITIKN